MARSLRPALVLGLAWGEPLRHRLFSTAVKLRSGAAEFGFRFLGKKVSKHFFELIPLPLTSHPKGYFGSMTLTSSELTGGLRFPCGGSGVAPVFIDHGRDLARPAEQGSCCFLIREFTFSHPLPPYVST